jgi:hypothetical protein
MQLNRKNVYTYLTAKLEDTPIFSIDIVEIWIT